MRLSSTLAGTLDLDLRRLGKDLGLTRGVDGWEISDMDAATLQDVPSAEQRWHDVFVLAAPSFAQASAWLPLLSLQGKARTVFLLVRDGFIPGRVGPRTIPQLAAGLTIAAGPAPDGYKSLQVSAGKWVDVHRAIAACLLRSWRGAPSAVLGGIRVGITDPSLRNWAAGDPLARFLTSDLLNPDEADIFPADVVVAPEPITFVGPRRPAGTLVPSQGKEPWSPTVDGWSTALPPIDTRWVSPQGFLPYPGKGLCTLSRGGGGNVLLTDSQSGCVLARMERGEILGEHMVAALRPHMYVEIDSSLTEQTMENSHLIAGLATAGVPLLLPEYTPALRPLGRELSALITAFSNADNVLVRESKSIDMRRAAYQLFAPRTRWARWSEEMGLVSKPDPTISVVLATRREGQVIQAVRQIAAQSWPNVEIIVVLHGIRLKKETEQQLLQECAGAIQILEVAAEKLLGEALNAGVAAASGEFIAKMDDDDWYGPHHLQDLMNARAYSGAQLVGSQVEFVYLEDLDIVTRRPPEGERYSNHVAGGTMLISKRDLEDLGGWRPVHRAVDRCLLQAVESAGGSVYRAHGQNYVMHRYSEEAGHGGHTWAPQSETFIQTSKQQWDGFVLPPQIRPESIPYQPKGRAENLRSIITRAASDSLKRPRLQGAHTPNIGLGNDI